MDIPPGRECGGQGPLFPAERTASAGPVLHFTLFDPDRQSPAELSARAKTCARFGTDAIMVGGSSSFGRKLLDESVLAVKRAVDLPVILFPNSAAAVSKHADYIFFMSLLNGDDPRVLIREQVRAAPVISRTGLRPISMAYIVVSTSRRPTSIERLVKLDKIGPDDEAKAAAYALAARFLGFGCVYLEAGSGADKPVPVRMVRAVRKELTGPLIVGGGIRSPEQAGRIAAAGADAIVTGTIVERDIAKLEAIIRAIKGSRARARGSSRVTA
jgi:phosphoglycerol geranylgeranyltransferase